MNIKDNRSEQMVSFKDVVPGQICQTILDKNFWLKTKEDNTAVLITTGDVGQFLPNQKVHLLLNATLVVEDSNDY